MTAPVRWCSSWNTSTTDFPARKKGLSGKQTVLFWYHLKSQPETVPQFPFTFSGEEEPRLFQQPPGRVILRSDQSGHPVYPKSWAPFAAMEQRTKLYQAGDQAGIDALEKQLLAQNAQFKNWTCSEEMMKRTKNGSAQYMHCLPADITSLSCKDTQNQWH